jgi:hypothetical protein
VRGASLDATREGHKAADRPSVARGSAGAAAAEHGGCGEEALAQIERMELGLGAKDEVDVVLAQEEKAAHELAIPLLGGCGHGAIALVSESLKQRVGREVVALTARLSPCGFAPNFLTLID